ncbi:MAG: hypothetical protein KC656_14265, partial [Myxococcales bacterium]|nr:hypothetical protein [Myxococcales bacterium]
MIALWNGLVDRRGSTRAMGLLRIGLVLVCWSRWAGELVLHHDTDPLRTLLSLAFFTASTALLLGWQTRVANVLFAAVLWWMYAWWGFEKGVSTWIHHHTYILVASVTWLAFTPAGGSFSVDRWLAVRRARAAG